MPNYPADLNGLRSLRVRAATVAMQAEGIAKPRFEPAKNRLVADPVEELDRFFQERNGFGCVRLKIGETRPSEGASRIERVARAGEAALTGVEPSLQVPPGGMDPADRPVRVGPEARVAGCLANRVRTRLCLERLVELAHKVMVQPHRPVRLPQPEPFFRALQQGAGTPPAVDALGEMACPESTPREHVVGLADRRLVIGAAPVLQRALGSLGGRILLPEVAMRVPEPEVVLAGERGIIEALEDIAMP